MATNDVDALKIMRLAVRAGKRINEDFHVTGYDGSKMICELTPELPTVQQPTAGATLSTEGTYDYKGYKVAKEDDIVILKIDLKKGYELVDAFWDEDQKATLLRDAGGNWYLAVPRGGGVLLSVKLKSY